MQDMRNNPQNSNKRVIGDVSVITHSQRAVTDMIIFRLQQKPSSHILRVALFFMSTHSVTVVFGLT